MILRKKEFDHHSWNKTWNKWHYNVSFYAKTDKMSYWSWVIVPLFNNSDQSKMFAISNDSKDNALKGLLKVADLDPKNREELRAYFERVYGRELANAMVKDY